MINVRKIIKAYFESFKQVGRFRKISWFETKVIKHQNDQTLKKKKFKEFEVYYKKPYELLHTYNDIFIDEIYQFNPSSKNPVIIDCGSNIGYSIIYFKILYPESIIRAFEPDSYNYEILIKNVNHNNLKNVSVERKAIWINNETISFSQKGTEASKICEDGSNESVRCARLKDILLEYPNIDFLKIDIEGAEFQVVKDCEEELYKIDNIFLEYHGKSNELHKLNTLLKIIENNNFKVYIKLAADFLKSPFSNKETPYPYDVQLNIFCYK